MGNQKQSRLELYIEILKTLGESWSLDIRAIQGRVKVGRSSLLVAMKFLEQQNLVQTRINANMVEYQNTHRGIRVWKYLDQGIRATDKMVEKQHSLLFAEPPYNRSR